MFAGGQSLKNGVDSPQPNRGWKPGVFYFVLSGRLRSLIFSLSMVLALEMRSRRCLPEQAGAALQLRGSQLSLHIMQELSCLPQAWVSTPGAQAFGSYSKDFDHSWPWRLCSRKSREIIGEQTVLCSKAPASFRVPLHTRTANNQDSEEGYQGMLCLQGV